MKFDIFFLKPTNGFNFNSIYGDDKNENVKYLCLPLKIKFVYEIIIQFFERKIQLKKKKENNLIKM